MKTTNHQTKLNPMQIETIINKIVPLIAAPKDHEYFRGVLYIMAENSSSASFGAFVAKCLKVATV